MRVEPQIFRGPDDVGTAAATLVADRLAEAAAARRGFVLGCPSGRSGRTTYRMLARLAADRCLDLSRVVIALMDEYVERTDEGYRAISPELPHSCVGFGRREILAPLNAAVGAGRAIPEANLWHPSPADPLDYDRRLAAAGGVDVFLLASGASDGHVALNPAGADSDSRTRVVPLEDSTRGDNLLTFPSLAQLDAVPRFGVTVGVGTIREQSKSVVMLALGQGKAEAVRRLRRASRYEADWPATVLADCRDPHFFVDREAAALFDSAA